MKKKKKEIKKEILKRDERERDVLNTQHTNVHDTHNKIPFKPQKPNT